MANNNLIYNAAIAGASTGQSSRWLISQNSASYTNQATLVAGFAAAVDALIAPTTINQSQADLLQSICAAFWRDRVLTPTSDITSAAAVIVADWTANQVNLQPVSGSGGDNKVKVSSGDTTADFLLAKLSQGSGITLTKINGGGNEQVQISGSAADDHKVAASATDTTPNFLFSKLTAGAAIALTLINGGGNESVQIDVSGLSLTTLSQVSASTSTNQFLMGNGPGVANSWGTLTTSPLNPGDNGKVPVASNGDFVYQLLTNAQISAAAGINCTKTDGNFSTVAVQTTNAVQITSIGFLQLGTTTATTGRIRLSQNDTIQFLDNTGLLNVQAMTVSNATLQLGGANVSGVQLVNQASGTLANFQSASTALTSLNLNFLTTQAGGPNIQHNSKASGSGATFSIRAQNLTGGSGNGGTLSLISGSSTGGLPGSILLLLGTNQEISFAVTNLSTGQRQTGINWDTTFGTVQMPANTGDKVTGVGDAATIPSANAVGGHIYYSDGGKPAWRFNSVNLRLDGTATTATAGGQTLPANPAGFLSVTLNGTVQKLPYYNT